MIQNLNKFSFAAFGQILPEAAPNHGFPHETGWKVESVEYASAPVWIYRVEGMPTYLDFERDMTVLAVARTDEALEYFYLDKPVRLNVGTLFAIIPRGTCTIVRAVHERGRWKQQSMLDAGALPLNITSQLVVRGIYTLFYQQKEKGFFFKGEKHDLFELVYVDQGALHNVVNGADTVLAQGEMMLYDRGLWHMQYAEVDAEVRFITVSFELGTGDLKPLVNRRIRLDAEATQLLRRMLEERESNDRYSGDRIISLLQLLLLTVLKSEEKQELRPKTPASLQSENKIVSAALAYISTNVAKKLSVPFVARNCNVSSSRLTKLFVERLAITPGEYIRRAKLEESKSLIRSGERNMSQIAQQLNYSSVQQFSRQFRAKFGVSPSEFAKSIR